MQLITINEVGEMIGVTGRTVRQYVNAGLLPVFKLPGKSISFTAPNGSKRVIARGTIRFDRAEVEQALGKYRQPAVGERKRHMIRNQPISPSKEILA